MYKKCKGIIFNMLPEYALSITLSSLTSTFVLYQTSKEALRKSFSRTVTFRQRKLWQQVITKCTQKPKRTMLSAPKSCKEYVSRDIYMHIICLGQFII